MLGSGDVDYMDPNITYYSIGNLAAREGSCQPYSYPAVAGQTDTAVADLAMAMPTVSADGLTATFR
jgi:peptide/nickel transport system substrate-binding protein